MALRRLPFLARLAGRYAVRHRGQTVRAVLGLLVTTTVVLTGLGLGDSFTGTFLEAELARHGVVDVVVRADEPADAARMRNWSAHPDLASTGARGVPTLIVSAAALNPVARKAEASVEVRGVDAGEREALGPLRGADGTELAEPARGAVVLASDLAGRLGSAAGERVELRLQILGGPGGVANLTLNVTGIAAPSGRGGVLDRPVALVALADLQAASGVGNAANAAFYSSPKPSATVTVLQALAPPGTTVAAPKEEAVREAAESEASFTGFIFVMGSFTILASFILAFALFASLVEERRAELGVMRALGLTRAEVALTMTLEGAVYSTLASLAGIAVGFAFLAGFLRILRNAAEVFGDGEIPEMGVEPGSVLVAFAVGALLPLLIVGVASLRFARLDPSRAIRGMSDDPRTGRTGAMVSSGLLILGGIALTAFTPVRSLVLPAGGWDMGMTLGGLVGIPVVGAGLALFVGARGRPVAAGAVAAAAVAWTVWTLYNFRDYPKEAGELDPMLTMARGLVLVLLLVVLAVASPAPYLAAARLLGRGGRTTRASFIALKYLVARRGAAGLTVAMIALVVLVVTVMGTLMATWSEQIPDAEGGYEVTGRSPLALTAFPEPLPPDLSSSVSSAEFLPLFYAAEPANLTRAGQRLTAAEHWAELTTATGITPAFADAVDYKLPQRNPLHGSDRAAWQAVAAGSALIAPRWMADAHGLAVGDRVTLAMGAGPARSYEVAGLTDRGFGLFLAAGHVRAMGPALSTSVYLKVAEGADPAHVAHRLTAETSGQGLTFQSVREEAAKEAAAFRSFVAFFQSFLALGLFVGLAATGFLAARAVHARVRDIGTLRAFGLEEGDVRGAFVLESAVTAVLGVAIGIGVGTMVAHAVWFRESSADGVPFGPPVLLMAAFAVTVVALAGLAAWWPARRAAKLLPALAVRHVD